MQPNISIANFGIRLEAGQLTEECGQEKYGHDSGPFGIHVYWSLTWPIFESTTTQIYRSTITYIYVFEEHYILNLVKYPEKCTRKAIQAFHINFFLNFYPPYLLLNYIHTNVTFSIMTSVLDKMHEKEVSPINAEVKIFTFFSWGRSSLQKLVFAVMSNSTDNMDVS